MPPGGPPGLMANIIDLTSDEMDITSPKIIDLTSVEDPRPSVYVSNGTEVKVEDESSTLVGSSRADSGGSSPNTQRDDDNAPTESNPTDLGDLSPRDSQHEGSNSSDNDLGTAIARSLKRKNISGRGPISKHNPSDAHLPRKSLGSLFGFQPLQPGFDKFFSVRNSHVDDPSSANTKQDRKSKTQQGRHVKIQQDLPTNPQILNIDRNEVLGRRKETKSHSSKQSTQQEPTKRQGRVGEQPPQTPTPRRAVSDAPETALRPREKTGRAEIVRPSQTCEEAESQRSHKRRKHNRRDDTSATSSSLADALNTTKSQVPPADELQSRSSETRSVERDSVISKYAAAQRDSSRFRPGQARTHAQQEIMTTHTGRRQDMRVERAWEQTQKSRRVASGEQQSQRGFILAVQNERGRWKRSRLQGVKEIASRRPPKSTHNRRATSGRDWNCPGAQQQRYGIDSGTRMRQLSSESDIAHTEVAEQGDDVRKDQEISEACGQQSLQLYGNFGQQESRKSYLKANTAQARVGNPEQTMSPDAREKLMGKARQFFENHPSNLALQRKVEVTNFIPPDVSRPSFAFRCQMVNASKGKRFGRKARTTTQKAEKRDKDRQRQILARRQKLEAQADQLWPNEPQEDKEKWIEAGIARLKQIFMKNDQKREAQKPQGLLTVEDLEDMGAAGSDRIDRPPVAPTNGKQRGIPIAEALEPGATITLYVVYISDPVERGKQLSPNDMKRLGDQFLRKEDANKHAEAVLRDERYNYSQLVSIQFRIVPEDGLFSGTKELADGKLVMCIVQRERQMASNLDLGDIYVRRELKETHSSRFDVFYTNIIPKVFLNKAKSITDQNKKENSKPKPRSTTPTTDVAAEPADKGNADDDRDSLFSATPTPEPENAPSEQAEAEEVEDSDKGDESDANSVVTNLTLAPSEPGGNLGSLSWNDVEYMHEHVCGFTTMELANQEAYKVALKLWRPRGNRMDPWLHYRNGIRPSLDELKIQELDVEPALLQFEVPEFEGHVDDRPWPFVHSTVFVKETRLEGPRDIGNHIVMGNGEDSGEDGDDDEDY